MSRAVAVLAAVALDAVLADPRRWHPVAGFGSAASSVELALYDDRRAAGMAHVAVSVGVPVLVATMLDRRLPRRGRSILLAAATWTALGGTSLVREGRTMGRLLAAEDLDGARGRLGYLCARNPDGLDAAELSRATVESLAENTSDAVIAPLFWAIVAGTPGVVAYRTVNTLDAMVGYRSERYENFGWAAARLDDVLNLLPARLTALLTCALAPGVEGSVDGSVDGSVGGSTAGAWRIWRRDAALHPSPNAGHPEAAFAGALGLRLGGTNVYAGTSETRGHLGDGPAPQVADIERAAQLSQRLGLAAGALIGLIGLGRHIRRGGRG